MTRTETPNKMLPPQPYTDHWVHDLLTKRFHHCRTQISRLVVEFRTRLYLLAGKLDICRIQNDNDSLSLTILEYNVINIKFHLRLMVGELIWVLSID